MKETYKNLKFMTVSSDLLDEDSISKNMKFGFAISSETRLRILKSVVDEPGQSISEIAQKFVLSVSAAAFHLKTLRDGGLIDISMRPSKKGKIQVCYLKVSKWSFDIYEAHSTAKPHSLVLSMPVGHYVNARLDFPSGFCTKSKQIMFDDGNYYIPARTKAEILWCRSGFVEYAFSNTFKDKNVKEISLSFEICSEVIGYHNSWKSDITFSLNGTELHTWTSPGDFGGRRGKLNPAWWGDSSTQYGHLKRISITGDGLYFDGNLISSHFTLEALQIPSRGTFIFRIENKIGAEHQGGFNIFGKSFGDYPQDITLTAVFEK